MLVLNLGAGKIKPILDKDWLSKYLTVVNLDTNYFSKQTPEELESYIENTLPIQTQQYDELYCSCDAFEFMEKFRPQFDRICMYRFLEHISFTQVLYFIYLVSTCIKREGIVDVIVPNYEVLAKMLLEESTHHPDFEKNNILLTTELLNEPSCPHASIWTVDRAKYFWEFENRFKIIDGWPQYEFDGRNIYMRFLAKRI
jgi:hypothetical protein